ncbi:MAG: hypothetical protein ACE5JG_08505 [Planctomycetota bacterium]
MSSVSGALAGLSLGAFLATKLLVLPVPAPPGGDATPQRGVLLVRVTGRAGPGDTVLATDRRTGRSLLARVADDVGGPRLRPLAAPRTGRRDPARLEIVGRVFYGLGRGAAK